MKKILLVIISVFLFNINVFSISNVYEAIDRASMLQGNVNNLGNEIYDLKDIVSGKYSLKGDEVFKQAEKRIKDIKSRAEDLKKELKEINKVISYRPYKFNVKNVIKEELDKLRNEYKQKMMKINDYIKEQADMEQKIIKLKMTYKTNVVKEGVKVFKDFFDLSKGGIIGKYVKHAYARITGKETEYEKDAKILKQQLETIKEMEKKVNEEYEKKINELKKEAEELKQRIKLMESLSKKVDSLISSYPEFFGEGSGTDISDLVKQTEEKKKKEKEEEYKNLLKKLNQKKCDYMDLLVKIYSNIKKYESELSPWIRDTKFAEVEKIGKTSTVSSFQILKQYYAKLGVILTDVESGIKESIKVENKIMNNLVSYIKKCKLKGAGLTEKDKERIIENEVKRVKSYISKISEEKDKLNKMLEKARKLQDKIEISYKRIEKDFKKNYGKVEKIEGIVKNNVSVASTKNNEAIVNNIQSPIKYELKKWKNYINEYGKLYNEIADLKKEFTDILSYGIFYVRKYGNPSEYPIPDAVNVTFPYDYEYRYRKNKEKKYYPKLTESQYQQMYDSAKKIENKIEEKIQRMKKIVSEMEKYIERNKNFLKWNGEYKRLKDILKFKEDNLNTVSKIAEDNLKILDLYKNIIFKAKYRDMEESKRRAEWEKGNIKAKELFTEILRVYDKLSVSKIKQEDIETILDYYNKAKNFRVVDGLNKENQKLYKEIMEKEDKLIKRWEENVPPVLKNVKLYLGRGTLMVKNINETLELYRDDLYMNTIEILGEASPYIYVDKISKWETKTYKGQKIKSVYIIKDGKQYRAKIENMYGDTVSFSYKLKLNKTEMFFITGYAVDVRGNKSLKDDFPRIKIKYINKTYESIAYDTLEKLKEYYENKNIIGLMSMISDNYYGDKFALEQNLREFFKNTENIHIKIVVDNALLDTDKLIVNFHWNKSYLDVANNKTQKQEKWETIILDTTDKNKILKSSETLLGIYSKDIVEETVALPHGVAIIVPTDNFMFRFDTGETFIGDWNTSHYDMAAEPWGVAAILMNDVKGSKYYDLGVKSIDSISSVPSDTSIYSSTVSDALYPQKGHCYAVYTIDKKFAIFEVLDIIPYNDSGSTEYKIQIEYKYQPDGSNSFK